MIKIMRFFPAVIFLLFWALIVARGLELKKATLLPIGSNRFISTMGRCIENPWTHNSALRIFFMRLRQVGAPPRIWVDSLPFGWELWHQSQYSGGIEIMMLIAHSSGNRLEQNYWAKKYAAIHPNDPQAHQLIKMLHSSPPGDVPAGLLGPW